MGLEQARYNMIEQQIRPWDVLDSEVLGLMSRLPRDRFVDEIHRRLAYADTAIPLGMGEVMMHPKVEARMLQALEVHSTDRVLEIGTGSGYVTALLAKLAYHVRSVDIHAAFTELAGQRLKKLGIGNIELQTGDASRGWTPDCLYDVVAITGSLPILPETYKHILNRGGRMFVVLGRAPVMEAVLIRRTGDNEWSRESLFETDLPPLINAEAPDAFVF
jgi:protein-L-isoaspartate(D-aspartate) O-methyltransferase